MYISVINDNRVCIRYKNTYIFAASKTKTQTARTKTKYIYIYIIFVVVVLSYFQTSKSYCTFDVYTIRSYMLYG